MSEIRLTEINFESFGRCVEICNDEISLVVTLDFGPRIIRFGFIGEENEFCQKSSIVVGSEFGDWEMSGGHRLWHSPENVPRTYIPDNQPVNYTPVSDGIRILQETETWTQIKKELEITFKPGKNSVQIVHRLTNKNAWPVELSVWGVTAVNTGGTQIIPLTQKDTGSLANRTLIFWPYTNIRDDRFQLFNKYVLIRQDPSKKESFKIGLNNEDGWAAYLNHKNLFIKRYEYMHGKNYPDFGSSYETYVNDEFTEMEALSPMEKMGIDESLTLTETWELVRNVTLDEISEKSIDKLVENYIL